MKIKFSDLVSPVGTIGGAEYVFWGVVLFAIKYNIDRIIAYQLFQRKWRVWEYLFPIQPNLSIQENRNFLIALLIAALPFVWSGCVLTVRRLRTNGLPVWLVILFFVPIGNLFFFAILALLPEEEIPVRSASHQNESLGTFLPAVLNALSAILSVRFSVQTMNQYMCGLYLGLPFIFGLIYSYLLLRKFIIIVSISIFHSFSKQ